MDYAVNLREATDTLVCSGFEFYEGNSPSVWLYFSKPAWGFQSAVASYRMSWLFFENFCSIKQMTHL